MCFASLSHYGS